MRKHRGTKKEEERKAMIRGLESEVVSIDIELASGAIPSTSLSA